MIVCVFSTTIERASKFLEALVEITIPPSEVLIKIKTENCLEIQLKDGSLYRALVPHKSLRGQKYNWIYIDREIEEEIVYTIIKPMQMPINERLITYFKYKAKGQSEGQNEDSAKF